MKKWACFSIFAVKAATLAPSIALFGIIYFYRTVIIKYICCMKGNYYYWDAEVMERPGIRKWVPLEHAGTTRRDTAFNYFKTQVLPAKKELFRQLIKDEVSSKGIAYYNGKIDGIIQGRIDDYINLLVCSDKSSITYSQKGNSGELQLIMQEFQYICKDLKNALSNLN